MCENRQKKSLLILNALLIFGLVAYAVIFLIINKKLNPRDILENYEAVSQRLFWRGIAEAICSLFGIIYTIGHIFVIYSAMRKKMYIPFQKILVYFIAQVGMMFVCVIPFAIFDLGYLGDYVFPIWNIAGILLLILIAYAVSCVYNRKIQQR